MKRKLFVSILAVFLVLIPSLLSNVTADIDRDNCTIFDKDIVEEKYGEDALCASCQSRESFIVCSLSYILFHFSADILGYFLDAYWEKNSMISALAVIISLNTCEFAIFVGHIFNCEWSEDYD